jgi:hypothetical protein
MPVPNDTKERFLEGAIDLANDTIRVLLVEFNGTFYTFDPDSDEFVSDVLGSFSELSGTNYSRQTLSNVTVTEDTADDEAVFDADNVTWSGIDAGTAQALLCYKQVGGDDTTPGDDPIIFAITTDDIATFPTPTYGQNLTVEWDAEGLVNLG